MSTFPALVPSSRTFTPGSYPNTAYQGVNGMENRVRHSNVLIDSTLQLEFIGLSEAQVLAILLHYQARRGPYGNFGLPAEVMSGVSSVADYSLQGYAWSYVEPPTVEDYPCGSHGVSVTLSSSVAPTADILPFTTTIAIGLSAGRGAAANGTLQTLSVTISPGVASRSIVVPSTIATISIAFPVPS
jgi:hypothetical protein